MRTLSFLSFIAASVAQTTISGSASGAVQWESGSTWSGGVAPAGSNVGAVTIQGNVQVTVSSALTFATSAALTLGASATAGTQLILNGTSMAGLQFAAAIFTWNNGYLVLNGNANFEALFGTTLAAGASVDRRLSGGVFTAGALSIGGLIGVHAQGGNLMITGTQLDSKTLTWQVDAGASITFAAGASSWLVSDATFNGGGNLVIAAGGALSSNTSNVYFGSSLISNPCNVSVAGNFTLQGSAQATVNAGSSLIVQAGGYIQRSQATSTNAINVAMSGTLEFAAGTTSWLDANIQSAGNVVIDAGATTTVSANSAILGTGSFNINGNLAIAAGVAATFQTATFANASTWQLAFAGSSFAAVTVKGALQVGGQLIVNIPVQPAATVVLVTAASISGSFSAAAQINIGAAAGRRLLSSGTVNQNSTTITYTPTSSAQKAGFIFMIPVLTGLALW